MTVKNLENLVKKEVLSLDAYVPSKTREEVKQDIEFKEVINLATNESVLGPSALVQEAIKSALPVIHQYPDGSSSLLRKEIASHLGINPQMLIITNGGDELIYLLGNSFITPGDEVIMGEYGFKTYENATTINGGKLIMVPFQKRKHDLPAMASAVSNKTKMIFLNNPHNPNGTIFTHKELRNFLKKIPQNIIIVLDEAYCDFVENQEFPDSIKLLREDDHYLVVLRTFSKIGGMAGLRIGFGIAPEEIIYYLKKIQPPYSVNCLAQVAARAFLADEGYREKLLQNNREGKAFLYQQFDRLKLSYITTEANFIYLDMKKDAEVITDKLMEKGIIVRSGKLWGCDTFLRITIGTQKQNQQLIYALENILLE